MPQDEMLDSLRTLWRKKPFCFSFKLKISRQISRPSFSFLNRVNLPFVGPVLNIFWCERHWVKLKWKELEIRLFLFFVFDWTEPKNKNNSCLKFFSDSKLLRRLTFNSNFNSWCHSFLSTCIKNQKCENKKMFKIFTNFVVISQIFKGFNLIFWSYSLNQHENVMAVLEKLRFIFSFQALRRFGHKISSDLNNTPSENNWYPVS